MKTGKHGKRRHQQQSGSGRTVLVTLYVTKPRRDDGSGASTASSRDVHHHHHHHHHHHSHGGSSDARQKSGNGKGYDRRAHLLEYSRQLRSTTAAATLLHPKPLSPHRDIKAVGAVRNNVRQPAADDDRRLVRPQLERAGSQQQIRQRCLGGDWNWKRVLRLVLPSNDSIESTRSRKSHREDSDNKNNTTRTKAWPAAVQLVGKLKKVEMTRRSRRMSNGDKGWSKKLFSMFRQ